MPVVRRGLRKAHRSRSNIASVLKTSDFIAHDDLTTGQVRPVIALPVLLRQYTVWRKGKLEPVV